MFQVSKENTYDEAHHHTTALKTHHNTSHNATQHKKVEKRSSFTWGSMGFGSAGTNTSGTSASAGKTGTSTAGANSGQNSTPVRTLSTHSIVTGGNNAIHTNSTANTHNTHNNSFHSPPPSTNNSNSNTQPNSSLRKSTSSATFAALQQRNLSHTQNSSGGANRDSFYRDNRSQSISSRYSLSSECNTDFDYLAEVPKFGEDSDLILADPLKVLCLAEAPFTLFVRTYFHKITELESFCNK